MIFTCSSQGWILLERTRSSKSRRLPRPFFSMKNAPLGAHFLVADSDDVYTVERTAEFLYREGVGGIDALTVE